MLKLVIFPLIIMGMVSLFSMTGLNANHLQSNEFGGGAIYPYSGGEFGEVSASELVDAFWDNSGHLVAYANGSAAGEAGSLVEGTMSDEWGINTWIMYDWVNSTGEYALTQEDQYLYFGTPSDSVFAFMTSGWGFIGLLAVVGGMMAVAGITIMATGIKGISVLALLVVGVFGVLWWILTGAASGLLFSLPVGVGWIGYAFMSLAYVIGCVSMIATGGGGAE